MRPRRRAASAPPTWRRRCSLAASAAWLGESPCGTCDIRAIERGEDRAEDRGADDGAQLVGRLRNRRRGTGLRRRNRRDDGVVGDGLGDSDAEFEHHERRDHRGHGQVVPEQQDHSEARRDQQQPDRRSARRGANHFANRTTAMPATIDSTAPGRVTRPAANGLSPSTSCRCCETKKMNPISPTIDRKFARIDDDERRVAEQLHVEHRCGTAVLPPDERHCPSRC